jgi:hypothetical protein
MNTMAGQTRRSVYFLLVASAAFSTNACVAADAGIGSYEAKSADATGQIETGNREPTAQGIAITAGEVPGFASPYLGAVRLILSNTTPDFIQVDSVSLSFGEELDKHVSIPAGIDISGWGRAMAPRVWSWVARNHVGSAYHPAADILTDIERFQQSRLDDAGQPARKFPSEHLMAVPFSIPPGLSTMKWLVIKSDANVGTCLERMVITLQKAKGEPQRLLVQFRDKALSQSEWQRAACAAAAPPSGWGV